MKLIYSAALFMEMWIYTEKGMSYYQFDKDKLGLDLYSFYKLKRDELLWG